MAGSMKLSETMYLAKTKVVTKTEKAEVPQSQSAQEKTSRKLFFFFVSALTMPQRYR